MSTVVTFYSFKGGVGRSMGLASVAVLLAQRGLKVLAVDWDLEAPGLHAYFKNRLSSDAQAGSGLLDLISSAARTGGGAASAQSWREHVRSVDLAGTGHLDLLPAGRQDAEYVDKLARLDWGHFFAHREGGAFIETLREQWLASYQVTLIDSRTGFTDAGGVCTIQLPDILVAVFSANEQSVAGVTDVLRWAQDSRRHLAYERTPLLVLPLPSRWDGRVEVDLSKPWLDRFETAMAPYYADWVPLGTPYRRILELMRVPHVGKYGFGERLPVLEDSLTDPEGVNVVYERVASLIDSGFGSAKTLVLGERPDPTDSRLGESVDRLLLTLKADVQARVVAGRLQRAFMFLIFTVVLALASAGLTLLYRGGVADWEAVQIGLLAAGVGATAVILPHRLRTSARNQEALGALLIDLESASVLRSGSTERQLREYELVRDRYRAIVADQRSSKLSLR